MTYRYLAENQWAYFTKKETAFRTNSEGKDTDLAATDTVYCMPVRNHRVTQPPPIRDFVHQHITGYTGQGYLGRGTYPGNRINVAGDMDAFSLLYFLCSGCTTTDDTPAAGYYTHVYATSTARTIPPPTTQVLIRQENATAGENINRLWVGAALRRAEVSWAAGTIPQARYEFEAARAVTQVALNSYPTFPAHPAYPNLDDGAAGTDFIKKATAAYNGAISGFRLVYDNGARLFRGCGGSYPLDVRTGKRSIMLETLQLVEDDTLFADSHGLDPTAANDVDITLRLYRNTTNDYVQFAFEKLQPIRCVSSLYDDFIYQLTTQWVLNPHETGNKLTITVVDDLDDDRYEG